MLLSCVRSKEFVGLRDGGDLFIECRYTKCDCTKTKLYIWDSKDSNFKLKLEILIWDYVQCTIIHYFDCHFLCVWIH